MKFRYLILLFVFSFLFFSFRINKVPQGITIDEAAFGYNAVLLSRTFQDENSRTLPIFTLSINGKDWRNPVPQYSFAVFFKIFKASVENLRLVSVLYASVSAVLLFYLTLILINKTAALFSYFLFLVTPIIMLHSHLGLDILTPIPFILSWLTAFTYFNKTKKIKYLLLAAFSLGLAFYSYKAARAIIPVWSISSAFYLYKNHTIKSAVNFCLFISPFYFLIPLLEYKYAGAILGGNELNFSIYPFFKSYLSSFDLSFLFIEGDQIIHHTTTLHGMLLLSTLPLILIGFYQSLQSNKSNHFNKFILLNLILGPILIGLTGSYHRASRLAILTPLFIYLASLGFYQVYVQKNKLYFKFILILIFINSYSFLHYYWFKYSLDTYHHFYDVSSINVYQSLSDYSKQFNTGVYQTGDMISSDDQKVVNNFLRSIYFTNPIAQINNISDLPENSLLITRDSNINLPSLPSNHPSFYIYQK